MARQNTSSDNSPLILDLKTIHIDEPIGFGRFPIFRAIKDGQEIAVKKMNCNKFEVPPEVEIQYGLSSHPNILPFLGIAYSQDGFSLYICMELADKSLHDYLHEEKKKPTIQRSSKWALQIARGMHHLHKHGLAHRDLKSGNVLLFEKQDILKICDFGSARVLHESAPMSAMNGTQRWMAPECGGRANTIINQRCDVFSFAMVLYEIFAHRLPYSELKDEYMIERAVLDGKRPVLHNIPQHIKELNEKCWKHNSHDRPTFEQILKILVDDSQLLQAAESGDIDGVKQMIADCVDVNTRNEKGETALHIASRHGYLSIVNLLIEAKAGINLQNKEGRTPLYLASWNGHLEIVELLLKEKRETTNLRSVRV